MSYLIIISVSIAIDMGIFICYGLNELIFIIIFLLNFIIIAALVNVIVLDKDSLRGHLKMMLSKALLILSGLS